MINTNFLNKFLYLLTNFDLYKNEEYRKILSTYIKGTVDKEFQLLCKKIIDVIDKRFKNDLC